MNTTIGDISAIVAKFQAEALAKPLPVRFETADVGALVRALDAAGVRPRQGGETLHGFAAMSGMPIVPNADWPAGDVMVVYADGSAERVSSLPFRGKR